jgi:hypothetical protein
MKRLFVPLLAIALVATLLGACVDTQPQPQPKHKGKGFYTPTPPATNPDGTTTDEATPPPKKGPGDDANTNPKPTNPVPETAPVQVGNLPYGKPVPGKPGFVFSPYDPSKGYIDVRGFPPGTEVKDPYSGKSFLVP